MDSVPTKHDLVIGGVGVVWPIMAGDGSAERKGTLFLDRWEGATAKLGAIQCKRGLTDGDP